VNSNPQRTGYVFGATGTAGAGYYSMETRDAYKQISHQLQIKAGQKVVEYNNYEWNNWLCCFDLSPGEKEAKEAI
jgi:hypothetical protein